MDFLSSFDDVLLQPKFSFVRSRKDVNTNSFFLGLNLSSPIISSNMDTVTNSTMAAAMALNGGIGALHRFQTIEENVQEFYATQDLIVNNKLYTPEVYTKPIVSVGIGEQEYLRAEALFKSGATHFLIDVAHGAAIHVVEQYDRIRNLLGDNAYIIVGNFSDADGINTFNTHVKSRRKPDAFKACIGSGCFSAGTRILMSNGSYKNIEDIRAGDRVINKDGVPVNVIGNRNSGIKKVIKYKTNNFYKESYATSDHKHWVGDCSTIKNINTCSLVKVLDKPTKRDESKYKWKRLDETEKTVMLLPKNINFELPETFEINMKEFSIRDKSFITMNYTEVVRPSYELGYLFGTFLGDGNSNYNELEHTTTGSVHWSYGLSEMYIAEKTKDALKTVFNVDATINQDKNIYSVNAYCLPLARFFNKFGKKRNKSLDWKFLVNEKNYLKGIYDGLIDSDGNIDGARSNLTNTSSNIIELFGFLNYMLNGYYPSMRNNPPSTGGLKNCNITNCSQPLYARTLGRPERYMTDNYQAVRFTNLGEQEIEIETYDIEVDDETHSFIANNVIVHNSLCTTRIVTGCGAPALYSIMDCASTGFPIIADGGIRNSGDFAKAMAAGATTVMLGGLLAGTDESPGDVRTNGKVYRGSASHSSYQTQGKISDHRTPEGEETVVPHKGPVSAVIQQLTGGLRSAMAYLNANNLTSLAENAIFKQVSQAGVYESKAHGKK